MLGDGAQPRTSRSKFFPLALVTSGQFATIQAATARFALRSGESSSAERGRCVPRLYAQA